MKVSKEDFIRVQGDLREKKEVKILWWRKKWADVGCGGLWWRNKVKVRKPSRLKRDQNEELRVKTEGYEETISAFDYILIF